MPRFIICGAPGAGKGTHAGAIAARYGIPNISTGGMFRAELASGSELGQRLGAIMATGQLVPDELTNEVVASRLAQPDCANGWLLDGYPRTLDQVKFLDGVLADQGETLTAVLMLEVPTEEVIKRLVKRAQIEGRADDTPEVIRHRQEVYEAQTAPVIAEYDKRGLVLRADGSGSIEASGENLMRALDTLDI